MEKQQEEKKSNTRVGSDLRDPEEAFTYEEIMRARESRGFYSGGDCE